MDYDGPAVGDGGRVRFLEHPRGGHCYYNGRDMERVMRTMQLLCWKNPEEAHWGGYLDRMRKQGEIL